MAVRGDIFVNWVIAIFLAISLTPTFASAQGCDTWLLPDFWLRAGAVEVIGCEGRRVEERGENGATAMHLAAGYGFVSAVYALALRDLDSVNQMIAPFAGGWGIGPAEI